MLDVRTHDNWCRARDDYRQQSFEIYLFVKISILEIRPDFLFPRYLGEQRYEYMPTGEVLNA